MGVEYYQVCIREGLLCGKGVEPPWGRGRLIGVRETQLFLRSNQSNLVDYTILIICGHNGAKMYLVIFIFLICVTDSMKGFSRCGYWVFCGLFVVCVYIYMFGWLCRATYCSVVSTWMLHLEKLKRTDSCWERLAWGSTIRHYNSRRGKKELKSSRDINARHAPYWGGGRRACYVSPDLSYD